CCREVNESEHAFEHAAQASASDGTCLRCVLGALRARSAQDGAYGLPQGRIRPHPPRRRLLSAGSSLMIGTIRWNIEKGHRGYPAFAEQACLAVAQRTEFSLTPVPASLPTEVVMPRLLVLVVFLGLAVTAAPARAQTFAVLGGYVSDKTIVKEL